MAVQLGAHGFNQFLSDSLASVNTLQSGVVFSEGGNRPGEEKDLEEAQEQLRAP